MSGCPEPAQSLARNKQFEGLPPSPHTDLGVFNFHVTALVKNLQRLDILVLKAWFSSSLVDQLTLSWVPMHPFT